MQNCCIRRAILLKCEIQGVIKGPVTVTNNHCCCFQSQWTGKICCLDPLWTTQSLFEQCGQSQKELVLNYALKTYEMPTPKLLLLQGVCKIRQRLTAAWTFLFKLMLIKCMNCSGFHLFSPIAYAHLSLHSFHLESAPTLQVNATSWAKNLLEFYSRFQLTVVLLCCKILWFTVLALIHIKTKTDT